VSGEVVILVAVQHQHSSGSVHQQ